MFKVRLFKNFKQNPDFYFLFWDWFTRFLSVKMVLLYSSWITSLTRARWFFDKANMGFSLICFYFLLKVINNRPSSNFGIKLITLSGEFITRLSLPVHNITKFLFFFKLEDFVKSLNQQNHLLFLFKFILCLQMSNGDMFEKNHDEIDIEFLGNIRGKDWRIQTNIYGNGSTNVGREERYNLWFDPAEDYHQYSILWTDSQIM